MINVATKKIMSQHNEDQKTYLCRENGSLCRDMSKKSLKKNVAIFVCFFVTLIKENGSTVMS